MTAARATPPRPSLLLVNPLHAQWLDRAGQPLPKAPAPGAGVRVVADLVEETHVRIDVPAIVGKDRRGFIDMQYQNLLPDVPLRGSWEAARAQPALPRPFRMHVVGVSAPLLGEQLQALAGAGHAIEGVWTLSYLLAHWARRQGALPRQGWLLLCLSLPYGMRMVLLHAGVPVFSRLLLETHPPAQVREVGLTLKYLADNRVLERDTRPGVLALEAGPGLEQGLRELGLPLLPAPGPQHPGGMLAQVLALAGAGAPGQLAGPALRRHHVAARTRRQLHAAAALLLVAGLAGLALQARALLLASDDSRHLDGQARQMEQTAQALRDDLARRGANVPLLRLVMQVHQQELQGGADPARQLWRLGDLLASRPQAQLVRAEQALRAEPCAQPGASVPGDGTPAATGAPRAEWQFEIRPAAALLPRQRQLLLQDLGQAIARWDGWQVQVDPVRLESATALAGGQAGADQAPAVWRWCLAPRQPVPPQEAPA